MFAIIQPVHLRRLLLSFMIINPVISPAQNYVDLVRVSTSWGLPGDNYHRMSIHEIDAQLPLRFESGNVLIIGAAVSENIIEDQNTSSRYALANLTFRLGYQHKIDDHQDLLLMFLGRQNGHDFSWGRDDRQYGGLLIYSKRTSETFSYKLGVYVNKEFFGTMVTPIIGLDWKINDHYRAFGNLPVTFTLERRLSDRIRTGLYYSGYISSYLQQSPAASYIQRDYYQVSAFLDYRITSHMVIQLRPGLLISSQYRSYNDQDKVDLTFSGIRVGDHRTSLSGISGSGIIFQAGIILRYPKQ